MFEAKIRAVGCYVPPRVLTNHDLEQMVDTNDQWIVERTGIRERHIAAPEMATSDMALEAAQRALANAGLNPGDIDAIIVSTVTPDMFFPATACLVQERLGAKGAWGFDLSAACSGFIYGLTTAAHLVKSGAHRRVLLIGADTMSRILDYQDRTTCVLFGDGAGAMIVERSEEPGDGGLIDYIHEIDGSGGDMLKMPAGGSRKPATCATVTAREHYVHQQGGQVFKYAVGKLQSLCEQILERNKIAVSDLSLLIPHQANRRIIAAVSERLGLRDDQVVINIDRYGNTTAATIPLATNDALESGRLQKGNVVLFAAVGAGYTAGVSLWRWSY